MRVLIALLAVLVAGCAASPTAPPGPSLPLSITTTEGATVTEPAQDPELQFLSQIRADRVPTSTSGQAEIQIGRGVCKQSASGSTDQALARDIMSIGWTAEQAADIVAAAHRFLCP